MTGRPPRFTEISALAVAVFGLIAFAYLAVPAVDSDYGWHVANGRDLLDGQLLAGVDTYSWTARGATWIAHEWLTEGLMAFLHDSLGPTANSLLAGALGAAAILLTVARLRIRKFGVAVALVVGLLALLDAGTVVSVRPLVVEVFAVALLLWLIDTWKAGGIETRRFAAVVVLEFLVWANTHGSFALGLAILGATWLGLGIERDGRARVVVVVAVGSALVTLVNPFGLRLIGYVASAVTGSRLELIAEWAPPDLASSMWWPFVVAIVLAGVGMLAGIGEHAGLARFGRRSSSVMRAGPGSSPDPRRVRLDDALIAVALGFMGLQHGYHAGLFGIAAAPAIAAGIATIVHAGRLRIGFNRHAREGGVSATQTRKRVNLVLLAFVALLGASLVWARVGPSNTEAAMQSEYPVAALPALDKLAAALPGGLCLFNDYSWGGWLEMVRPEIPVFIDGRSEVYGDAQVARYATISGGGPRSADALAATGAITALIQRSSELAAALEATTDWTPLYIDDHAVLLVFTSSEIVPGSAAGSGADSAPCLPR